MTSTTAAVNPSRASSRSANLRGKRAAMLVFSYYPMDPRPRRAAEALVTEGMSVDLICLGGSKGDSRRETVNGVDVRRLPLERRRGGAVGYVFQYGAFLLACLLILAARSLTRRYDLVYVHNMPDVLVVSALVPRMLGAKVILDLHDPMPELMMTIFGFGPQSVGVRLLRRLERWSIARADVAITVNRACQRLFASRSCRPEKIRVVMNSPDESIFGFRPADEDGIAASHPGRPFVIMYHGSLVERNGLDLAVAAIARLRPSMPDVELRVYGAETAFLTRVMETVRAQGLDGSVRHLGARRLEEIVGAIEQCDVGVIPNQRNIFTELNTPTRIFEYLALGKPVIAPRSAGVQDYFDEDALVFFELGDDEDLARTIAYVRAERQKVAGIVRRGQAVYAAHVWGREREVLLDIVSAVMSPR